MKHILSIILITLFSLSASAQMMKIGTFSYDAALHSMPDYAIVQKNISDLRAQYDAEVKSSEKEFSEKYELFLEQQAAMNTAIREKRQSELQIMMERNVAFRAESRRLVKQAEAEAMKPLKEKLDGVIKKVGEDNGYIIILNTDANACPFIQSSLVEDVNALIVEELSK